ncbi:MAG: undecaprenyldiphospho-muramoylpentapeptide beta-N-acetylglucosaminyltransferase [Erysipelothrix sp.]|nr:undecaprenyldiphospho-muramoylpentapeptide beta-N-acetylglucosaminyltransferase [Erysipelothrix sp.]
MKIVISTGGTGGHIYPAIALADYMQDNLNDIEITFTGSSSHMEKDIVTKAGYEFTGYALKSGSRSIFHKLLQYMQLTVALVKMYFKFLFNRPDLVMGFGAYITAPTLMAAKFLNIPIVLHEQNSSIGKTNEMFFNTAALVIVCYPDLKTQLDSDKVLLLGNPRASQVANIKKDASLISELELDVNKKTLLVVMGSLGSETVNEAMSNLIPSLEYKDYQMILVTGKKHYDSFCLMDPVANVKILPYVDQAAMLASVDLVIARGGATTAAEICALGIPSIIIPSPYVSNDHQYINALELEKVGAAKIIKEDELTLEALIETIDAIINSDEKLTAMHEAALTLAMPNASETITNAIVESLKDA